MTKLKKTAPQPPPPPPPPKQQQQQQQPQKAFGLYNLQNEQFCFKFEDTPEGKALHAIRRRNPNPWGQEPSAAEVWRLSEKWWEEGWEMSWEARQPHSSTRANGLSDFAIRSDTGTATDAQAVNDAMSWHGDTAFDPPAARKASQQGSPTSTNSNKRKRSSVVGIEASDDGTSPSASKQRNQPGVKRACNDCRQQKLRCNVQTGADFKPCDRCIKHELQCSIDNDFKRLGKRAAHEDMVQELAAANAKLAEYEARGLNNILEQVSEFETSKHTTPPAGAGLGAPIATMAPFVGPNEAAASRSLLDLAQSIEPGQNYPSITRGTSTRTLGRVTISDTETTELYNIFFASYHPFMSILTPELPYTAWYNLHPLLHWTIIAISSRRYDGRPQLLLELQQPLTELLWTTLSQIPPTYHVVKALVLLCTWAMPSSSTSQEPTMMLTGTMIQLALQFGLHRPSHAQDFSRFRIELREEDIEDRMNVWAACNIIAQNVSTGQGQPTVARWAWYTHGLHLDRLKKPLAVRCKIEKFCHAVTMTVYTMQRDHIVTVDQAQRSLQIDMFARELGELEVTVLSTGGSDIDTLYLKAAALHLRLSAFFDDPNTPTYHTDLRNVYIAACSLLTHFVALSNDTLIHSPNYIMQLVLAAGFTMLKLLNSSFAAHVDIPTGRTLFSQAVGCLRQTSVRSNDLPQRLAEVMAQLWQNSGASEQRLFNGSIGPVRETDNYLTIRVRCRSSMSVVYDSIWRWREQSQQTDRESLDRAVEHPTIPDSPTDINKTSPHNPATGETGLASSHAHSNNTDSNNTGQNATLVPAGGISTSLSDMGGGSETDLMAWDGGYGGNAVFDPLSWALDGNLNFPFTGNDGLGF